MCWFIAKRTTQGIKKAPDFSAGAFTFMLYFLNYFLSLPPFELPSAIVSYNTSSSAVLSALQENNPKLKTATAKILATLFIILKFNNWLYLLCC